MLNWRLDWVCDVLAVPRPPWPMGETFSSVCTDSRAIEPGCLFVAIEGEKHDGHDFVAEAFARGALAALVRRGTPNADGRRLIEVDDTLRATRALARAWLRRLRPTVFVVAGSVGKTTAKEMLAAMLSGRYDHVLKTRGSENGFLGIALTLLRLRPQHRAAVIEVGIDEVGAMAQHLEMIEPDYAIVTAIGPEHLEKLASLETVTREESLALTATLDRGGTIALNLDEPELRPLREATVGAEARVWSYSFADATARVRGRVVTDPPAVEFRVHGGGVPVRLPLVLPGEHNARNELGAAALALAAGLEANELSAGLARFEGAPGRTEMIRLASGTRVLSDYYNANPSSMRAALALLRTLGPPERLVVALGDMLELGDRELDFHRELAAELEGIERVFLYGERMKVLHAVLPRSRHFESHAALAAELANVLEPTDTLLVKGSRSTRMENVLHALRDARR